MENKFQLSNKLNYLKNNYTSEKESLLSFPTIETGLHDLDAKLKIRNGVILCGGLPSVGKSTLAIQFVDQFAQQGHDVLFFSLEQSECDLTAKSINRIAHTASVDEDKALDIYASFAHKITTATVVGSAMVEDVVQSIDEFVTSKNVRPIVFIDYLQLLKTKKQLGKRESIEEISQQLVAISKKHKLVVFVISSLNRANYLSPIDMESFKESGSLEYDADVILGIQYQLISSIAFTNCSSVDKKRLMIAQEKSKHIRGVELVCIKNRFGQIFESCKMNYMADKDLFIDASNTQDNTKKKIQVL